MTAWRVGVVQIAALVVAFAVICVLFLRIENNRDSDLHEQRRTDLAICESEARSGDADRAQINQLAQVFLDVEDNPTARNVIENERDKLLALVDPIDCSTLPQP